MQVIFFQILFFSKMETLPQSNFSCAVAGFERQNPAIVAPKKTREHARRWDTNSVVVRKFVTEMNRVLRIEETEFPVFLERFF